MLLRMLTSQAGLEPGTPFLFISLHFPLPHEKGGIIDLKPPTTAFAGDAATQERLHKGSASQLHPNVRAQIELQLFYGRELPAMQFVLHSKGQFPHRSPHASAYRRPKFDMVPCCDLTLNILKRSAENQEMLPPAF